MGGTGADPGFFLGGGAPLGNGITDQWGKKILKANTKKKASSQGGGGVHTPCSLPLDPLLGYLIFVFSQIMAWHSYLFFYLIFLA